MNALRTKKIAVVETLESRDLRSGTPIDFAWSIAPVGSATLLAGSKVAVSVTVTNVGNSDAKNYHESFDRYFLSRDNAISADDVQLSVGNDARLGIIGRGKSAVYTDTLTIPSGTAAGNYFVLAKAAPILDHGSGQQVDNNPGNNAVSMPVQITRLPEVSSTNMSLVAHQPYGFREDKTSFTVQLRDSSGKLLAGKSVSFLVRSDKNRTDKQLVTVSTDQTGQARLDYKIPKDTAEDNIMLTAVFGGDDQNKGSKFATRIRIGTRDANYREVRTSFI
jgi:hypothetical protein